MVAGVVRAVVDQPLPDRRGAQPGAELLVEAGAGEERVVRAFVHQDGERELATAEDDQRDNLILDLKSRIEVLESTKQTKDAIYTHHLESELKRVNRNLANVEGLK